MSKPIKVSEVMTSLYGPTATQMMGGSKCTSKKCKRTGGKGEYEECMFPEYVENKDFQKFIHEFYLIKKVAHSFSSSVYVIPESADLDKMISEFKSTLKKENIAEKTIEAYQYTIVNDLPYKRCIFNVFADADSAHYKLDKEAPYKNFGTVKRTNLLSEQYFFKYKSDSEILICPSESSEKGATTVKLIAKCSTGIYVFQGPLPKADLKYEKKISQKAFVGGSLKANSLTKFNKLGRFINRFGESGAERFIGSILKANSNSFKAVARVFSGDLLHAAFRVCFDDNIPEDSKDISATEAREFTKKLIKAYKPSNKQVDAEKFANIFKNSYATVVANSLTPKESSKQYVSEIMRIYGKIGKDMLYADIATNLYRNNDTEDFQDIYNIVENIESVNEDRYGNASSAVHLEFADNSSKAYQTSKLCNYINSALLTAPLVGVYAKTYYPQLQSIETKEQSYNMYGGYFENVYGMNVEESEDVEDDRREGAGDDGFGEIEGDFDDVEEYEPEDEERDENETETEQKQPVQNYNLDEMI